MANSTNTKQINRKLRRANKQARRARWGAAPKECIAELIVQCSDLYWDSQEARNRNEPVYE